LDIKFDKIKVNIIYIIRHYMGYDLTKVVFTEAGFDDFALIDFYK